MKHSTTSPLRRLLILSSVVLLSGLLSACYHSHSDVLEGDGFDSPEWTENALPNTELVISTRATAEGDEEEISYPIYVYLFKDGACVRRETLSDADATLSLDLVAGDYGLYAVAGANEAVYELPTVADATTESLLALRDAQTHGDLMVATPFPSLALEPGETRNVTLALQRKVMLLQEVVLNSIPQRITAVRFELSPLYAGVQIDGAYTSATSTESLSLAKGEGGTWSFAEGRYLLPASTSNAVLTVKLTSSEGTKSYSYVCVDQLEANYKIKIHGTYTETGVTLTGTITGSAWAGEREITFEFDESGSSTSGGSSESGGDDEDDDDDSDTQDQPTTPGDVTELPQVGEVYQGCYVLAVDGTRVTLLAPKKVNGIVGEYAEQTQIKSACAKALESWWGDYDAEWRMLSTAEAQIVSSQYGSIIMEASFEDLLETTNRYIFNYGDTSVKYFEVGKAVGTGQYIVPISSSYDNYYLIAVADVTISNP